MLGKLEALSVISEVPSNDNANHFLINRNWFHPISVEYAAALHDSKRSPNVLEHFVNVGNHHLNLLFIMYHEDLKDAGALHKS